LEAEAGGVNDGSINHIQAHSEEHNDAGRKEDSGNKGVGAPHIRDRLYWVADSRGARLDQRQRVAGIPGRKTGADERQAAVGNGVCSVVGLADMHGNGFWRDADWLRCRDGKWRPVEPGAFPLVARTPPGVVRGGSDGFPIDSDKTGEARVMRLRGYGNSINAVQAQAFIEAFMDYQQQVSA